MSHQKKDARVFDARIAIEVEKHELEAITARRQKAFNERWKGGTKNLVGLALSGGGIRSAMFNRGLLQSFSHRGLLRYVDYLSSVSGGGYIAGWLGECALSLEGGTNFHDSERASLGTKPETGQHETRPTNSEGDQDYAFQRAGKCLDLWSFIPRYVSSTFPVTLLWVSLLALLSTGAALFWRAFDHPYTYRVYFNALGFNQIADELLVAFTPAILMVLIWATLRVSAVLVEDRWATQKVAITLTYFVILFLLGPLVVLSFTIFAPPIISYGSEPPDFLHWLRCDVLRWAGALLFAFGWLVLVAVFLASAVLAFLSQHTSVRSRVKGFRIKLQQCSQYAFWAVVTAAFVSLAVYLGNGYTGYSSRQENNVRLNQLIAYLSFAAAIVQLIPLLGQGSLARSAADDAQPWQRRALSLLSYACVAVPLFALVHWMAREDISNFATFRGPRLQIEDVKDWSAFGRLLSNEKLIASPETRKMGDKVTSDAVVLESHRLKLRGVADQELTERDTSWREFKGRPILSFSGSARAWTTLLFGFTPHINSADVNGYRQAYEDAYKARSEVLSVLNQQLFDWRLTAELIDHAVRLARRSNDAAERDLWSVGYDESHHLHWRVNWLLADPKASSASVDRLAVGELVRQRMDYMEDWDDPDRATFWTEWSGFISLLPRNDPLDRTAVLTLLAKTGQQQQGTAGRGGASLPTKGGSIWSRDRIAGFNRRLLELLYPKVVRERTMVSTLIVPMEDQKTRWHWFLTWGALSAGLLLFVDLNKDSAFYRYYSERLLQYYLRAQQSSDRPLSSPRPLHTLETWTRGMPYHLISAGLLTRPGNYGDAAFDPFLFSAKYCGNPSAGFVPANIYPDRKEPMTLSDAVAISGAAVTPLMTANPALRLVMRVFNFSLGAYLPHPRAVSQSNGEKGFKSSFLRTAYLSILDKLWPTDKWRVSFVADGGFREFLGAEELLRRRCSLVIVSDAGCNSGRNEFGALAELVRLARTEHGIQFLDLDHGEPLEIDRFRRKDLEAPTPQQFLCARIRYPNEPEEGLLIYLHMALTGKEDVDLQQFRKLHPKFPNESTSNQFFTPNQIESYRALGYNIGSRICRQLPTWSIPKKPSSQEYPMEFSELEYRLRLSYLEECYLETSFDKNDISPSSLFAVDLGRLKTLTLRTIADTREALRGYEQDADYRLAWRHYLATKLDASSSFAGDVIPDEWMIHVETLNFWLSPAKIAVALLACNEMVAASSDEPFQVGGRERLERLAEKWKTLLRTLSLKTQTSEFSEKQVAKSAWNEGKSLSPNVHTVFRARGQRTVKLFIELLITKTGPLDAAQVKDRLASPLDPATVRSTG